MTPCEQAADWIDAWLDDESSDENAARLAEHCVTCGACRRAWEAARTLRRDCGQLSAAAERIASEHRTPRVAQQAERERRAMSRAWTWRVAAAVALAATIAIATRQFKDRPSFAPIQSLSRAPTLAAADKNAACVVADAEGIVLRHPSHDLAVQYATNRSNVQVIWLYAPTPQSATPAPTTAPGA